MEERRSIQYTFTGLPQWLSGKESACQCSRRVWTLVREDPKCYGAAEVCAPQQENPPQWEAHAPQPKSSPCSLQLEKSQHTATKTQHNHKQIKKKKKIHLEAKVRSLWHGGGIHQRKSGLFGFSFSEALEVGFSLSPQGESSSCSHSLGPMSPGPDASHYI